MEQSEFKIFLSREYIWYELNNKVSKNCRESMEKILDCKTKYAGGFEYVCFHCGELKAAYNSCRNRNCPFCSEKLNNKWYNEQIKRLPKLKYQHIVFTVPHELNKIYLENKKAFSNILFGSVKYSIEKQLKKIGLKSGFMLQMHSNSSNQNLHLHIHCLVLKGGLDKGGNYVKKSGVFLWISDLIDAYRSELIKRIEKLIGSTKNKKVLKAKKRNWNVKLTEEFKDQGKAVLKYLSRSKNGGTFKPDMFLKLEKGRVHFTDKSRTKKYNLKKKEFMRRLLLHIPEKNQKLIRNYGLFHSSYTEELQELVLKYGVISSELLDEKVVMKCPSCKNEMVVLREIPKEYRPHKYIQRELFSKKRKA